MWVCGVTYFSVQSSKLSTERPVDVGAHWVGVTQHRVMDLAKQFGLGRRTQYLRGTKVMQVWSPVLFNCNIGFEFRWVMGSSGHMTQSFPTLVHGLPS